MPGSTGHGPLSRSIQAKGLVPARHILFAPCPLDARGQEFAKLGHLYPHSKAHSPTSSKDESLETRFCLGSRGEEKEAQGLVGREGWEKRGGAAPAHLNPS